MSTEKLTEIYNFINLSDSIATAGQPTVEQFSAIRDAGYQMVVNLALPTSTNALPNEPELVEALSMKYVAIPVIWENPTLEDFDRFAHLLNTSTDQKVFVHCAMNMRVSAFMYLYRTIFQKIDPDIAQLDLAKIWTPNPIWQNFIEQTRQHYLEV